jgi:hypothetical protein
VTVAALWRLWALAVAAVAAAALLVADRMPSDAGPALVRPAARMPLLPPAPAPADADAALDTLARSTIWGPLAAPADDAAGAAARAAAPAWSLAGYYEAAGVRRVIVSHDNAAAPSQQLAVGERLPDGATILAIEPDRVRVRRAREAAAAAGPRTAWLPIGPAPPVARR